MERLCYDPHSLALVAHKFESCSELSPIFFCPSLRQRLFLPPTPPGSRTNAIRPKKRRNLRTGIFFSRLSRVPRHEAGQPHSHLAENLNQLPPASCCRPESDKRHHFPLSISSHSKPMLQSVQTYHALPASAFSYRHEKYLTDVVGEGSSIRSNPQDSPITTLHFLLDYSRSLSLSSNRRSSSSSQEEFSLSIECTTRRSKNTTKITE